MSSHEPLSTLSAEAQHRLVGLARDSIQHGLQAGRPLPLDITTVPAPLREPRASFVTLEQAGQLRGCIGTLEAYRPLALDVVHNAFSAAFRDPRFPPLDAEEFAAIDVHLSLLTPAEPMPVESEDDLLRRLVPGVDGLILSEGTRRGTFLPSVWASLPEPRDFVRHLKRKAGLAADYWSDTLEVSRYRAESIP